MAPIAKPAGVWVAGSRAGARGCSSGCTRQGSRARRSVSRRDGQGRRTRSRGCAGGHRMHHPCHLAAVVSFVALAYRVIYIGPSGVLGADWEAAAGTEVGKRITRC